MTHENVLAELKKLGFSNIVDFVDVTRNGATLKDISKLDKDKTAAIAEISNTLSGVKFKLHDKKGSLELIGDHIGLFQKNIKLTGVPEQTNVTYNLIDPSWKDKIESFTNRLHTDNGDAETNAH